MRRWFRVRVDRDRVGELVLRALTFETDSNRLGTLQYRPDDFVAGEAVGSGVGLDEIATDQRLKRALDRVLRLEVAE